MAEVRLFRTFSSPFALRIVWALKLKSIEFDTVLEDFPHKSAELLKYNPVHKKVPVLVHNEKPISESLVILEYIEETWKETPLLPDDPAERATARFWAKFGDEKLLSSIFRSVLRKGTEQEEAKLEAMRNLEYVEEQLQGKRFFGGETIGYLDLVLGWMANLISILEETSGQDIIKEEQFPVLSKWMKDFSEVPVIKESMPPRDKLISKFQAMQQA
ncbi:hypothetical protein ACET3Z_017038 [Daucus carota]